MTFSVILLGIVIKLRNCMLEAERVALVGYCALLLYMVVLGILKWDLQHSGIFG